MSTFSIVVGVFLLIALTFVSLHVSYSNKSRELKKDCTAQTVGLVRDTYDARKGKRIIYWVEFTYSIESIVHEGKAQITLEDFNKLSAGMNITVFYDPRNMEQYYVLDNRNMDEMAKEYLWGCYVTIFLAIAVSVYVMLK